MTYTEIIERLNEQFGFQYSFEVLDDGNIQYTNWSPITVQKDSVISKVGKRYFTSSVVIDTTTGEIQ